MTSDGATCTLRACERFFFLARSIHNGEWQCRRRNVSESTEMISKCQPISLSRDCRTNPIFFFQLYCERWWWWWCGLRVRLNPIVQNQTHTEREWYRRHCHCAVAKHTCTKNWLLWLLKESKENNGNRRTYSVCARPWNLFEINFKLFSYGWNSEPKPIAAFTEDEPKRTHCEQAATTRENSSSIGGSNEKEKKKMENPTSREANNGNSSKMKPIKTQRRHQPTQRFRIFIHLVCLAAAAAAISGILRCSVCRIVWQAQLSAQYCTGSFQIWFEHIGNGSFRFGRRVYLQCKHNNNHHRHRSASSSLTHSLCLSAHGVRPVCDHTILLWHERSRRWRQKIK